MEWSTTLNIPPSRSPNGDYRGHLGSRLLRLKTTCNCSRTNRSITQLDVTWVVSMKRFTQSNTSPSGSPTGTTTRICLSAGLWKLVLRGPRLRCRQNRACERKSLEETSSKVHGEVPSLQVGSNLCHTLSCGCESQVERKNRTTNA